MPAGWNRTEISGLVTLVLVQDLGFGKKNEFRIISLAPELLGPEDIRTYQVYLINQKRASSSMLQQTVCALGFLYRNTLGKEWTLQYIPFPKQEKKLPVVLSQDEVSRFFESLPILKHRAILMTAYATGLRVSEVVASLRVADIDSERMMIRVELGKGQKDRYVMLSPNLLELLRAYWKMARPADWLFPGQRSGRHLTTKRPSLCQGQRFGWPDQEGACTCVEACLCDSSPRIGR